MAGVFYIQRRYRELRREKKVLPPLMSGIEPTTF